MIDYTTPQTIRRFPLTRLALEHMGDSGALEDIIIGWPSSESTLTITALQKPNSRGGMTIIGVDIVASIVVGNNTGMDALLQALECYAAAPRAARSTDPNHFHATFTLGGIKTSDKLTTVINSDGRQRIQMCNLNAPVAVEISADAANLIPTGTIKISTRVKNFKAILWS